MSIPRMKPSRIDLNSVITDMFIALGVGAENIYAAEESTVADPGLYHSFRRDGREFGIMTPCHGGVIPAEKSSGKALTLT